MGSSKHEKHAKDSKHKKSKSSKDSKEKKAKSSSKHKKEKKERKRASSSSSEDSSDTDTEQLSPQARLKREQAAVNALRDILWLHKEARKDLRELLWTIDQGKAANIAGVPDLLLKAHLQQLLKLLGLRKAGTKGVYGLPPGTQPTLSIVGFVFDEKPRPPAPPKPAPEQQQQKKQQQDAAPHHTQSRGGRARDSKESGSGSEEDDRRGAGRDDGGHVRDQDQARWSSQQAGKGGGEEGTGEEGGARWGGKRVVGPAMPSADMLAAAAEAAANAPEDGEQGTDGGEEDEDDGLLVGPMPPELLEETDAMPEDERAAEVIRIIRILRDAQTSHESSSALRNPLTAPPPGSVAQADAYQVLGVAPDASASDIKRRYMKLSLQIHPDKCLHKDAHTAFQAVSAAAKLLQDTGKRAALDEAREDKELRAMAEKEAAAQERARQWRVVKGEEPAAGPGSTVRPGPLVREAWMTELPEERKINPAANLMAQKSQTSFSQKGTQSRGDTSAWTDTPATAAARAAQGGNALQQGAAGPLMLTGAGGAGGAGSRGFSKEDAQIMDVFNSQARKRSLLDVHLEQQSNQQKPKKSKEDKKQKEEAGAAPAASKPAWAGKHPWMPFDRDTDLEIKSSKPKNPQALMQAAGSLGSKFSSGGNSRTFL